MRILAVLLVAFFVAVGCGGAQESGDAVTMETQEEAAAPASVDTGATAEPTTPPPSTGPGTGSPDGGAASPCDQEPCGE
jgi:hypothetical protein